MKGRVRVAGIALLILVALSALPYTLAWSGGGCGDAGRAEQVLTTATAIVNRLDAMGFNVSESRELLLLARKAYDAGDYNETVELSIRALSALEPVLSQSPHKLSADRLAVVENLTMKMRMPEDVKSRVLAELEAARANTSDIHHVIRKLHVLMAEHSKRVKETVIMKSIERAVTRNQAVLSVLEANLEKMSGERLNLSYPGATPVQLLPVSKLTPVQAAALIRALNELVGRVEANSSKILTQYTSFYKASIPPVLMDIRRVGAEIQEARAEAVQIQDKDVAGKLLILLDREMDADRLLLVAARTAMIGGDPTPITATVEKRMNSVLAAVKTLEKENLTNQEMHLLQTVEKIANELIEIAERIVPAPHEVTIVGVIAWIPDNKTLIVVGYRLVPIRPGPITIQERSYVVFPVLQIYKVDISKAVVKGKPEVGRHVLVVGRPAGVDPELGIPVVIAEKVIVSRFFVIQSSTQ